LAATMGGLAFPVAVVCLQMERGSAGRAAGFLYSADLAGACVGALLSSALLVPILGIPYTCLAIAAVELTGLWLMILPPSGR